MAFESRDYEARRLEEAEIPHPWPVSASSVIIITLENHNM
jgi:hypothetical protein